MNFLNDDKEKAKKEMDCRSYCVKQANEHFMNGNFEKAAAYHDNIARSLRELAKMKKDKQRFDRSMDLIKEAQHRQQREEMRRNGFVI